MPMFVAKMDNGSDFHVQADNIESAQKMAEEHGRVNEVKFATEDKKPAAKKSATKKPAAKKAAKKPSK